MGQLEAGSNVNILLNSKGLQCKVDGELFCEQLSTFRGGQVRQIQVVNVPTVPVQIIATSQYFIHKFSSPCHYSNKLYQLLLPAACSNLMRQLPGSLMWDRIGYKFTINFFRSHIFLVVLQLSNSKLCPLNCFFFFLFSFDTFQKPC